MNTVKTIKIIVVTMIVIVFGCFSIRELSANNDINDLSIVINAKGGKDSALPIPTSVPEIKTFGYSLNQFNCTFPDEFVITRTMEESIMAVSQLLENDPYMDKTDLLTLQYVIVYEREIEGWNSSILNDNEKAIRLAGPIYSGNMDEDMTVLHAVHALETGAICYCLGKSDLYLCCAVIDKSGSQCLVLYGIARTETGVNYYNQIAYFASIDCFVR